ncbi:hypothetical protein BY996DRAFT_3065417 [Phakopsora pachyrhizi]|nr:hypothetical protein BY996DRAFT_3065417 [Phakopsora pachyrhizi]
MFNMYLSITVLHLILSSLNFALGLSISSEKFDLKFQKRSNFFGCESCTLNLLHLRKRQVRPRPQTISKPIPRPNPNYLKKIDYSIRSKSEFSKYTSKTGYKFSSYKSGSKYSSTSVGTRLTSNSIGSRLTSTTTGNNFNPTSTQRLGFIQKTSFRFNQFSQLTNVNFRNSVDGRNFINFLRGNRNFNSFLGFIGFRGGINALFSRENQRRFIDDITRFRQSLLAGQVPPNFNGNIFDDDDGAPLDIQQLIAIINQLMNALNNI